MSVTHDRQAIDLDSTILAGNEDALVDALKKIKGERNPGQKRAEQVARLMERTESRRVRNAAALALADLRHEPAGERIWRLLERPGIGREAGTLLYALEELDCPVPLAVLVNLLRDASFEARQGVLLLLQAGRVEPGGPEAERLALNNLKDMSRSKDQDLADAAGAALNYWTAASSP